MRAEDDKNLLQLQLVEMKEFEDVLQMREDFCLLGSSSKPQTNPTSKTDLYYYTWTTKISTCSALPTQLFAFALNFQVKCNETNEAKKHIKKKCFASSICPV